jgi:hypothetical protein
VAYVATVSLSADTPNPGIQEIQIANDTGPSNGCNASYVVCDNVAIQDWMLTVDYTSGYYNGTGPSLASPYIAQWQSSADDILPTAALAFDLDLCGSNSVLSCASPTTTITEIDFSGVLGQSSFAIFDPTANGGAGGPGPTFFANPAFSMVFLPTSGFPADYYESQDASVGEANAVIPEPDFKLSLACMLAAAGWFRHRRPRVISRF